jgi:hypothetical protein
MELTFPDMPNAYVLVGAGGTGARVAALLPKIVRQQDSVIIIDGDTIEPKNIIRQHFVHEDVGKNKAAVVMARLKRALIPALRDNLATAAIPEMIHRRWVSEQANLVRNKRMIYIGCVDNAMARETINGFFGPDAGSEMIWFDCGNLLRHGQVLLARLNARTNINMAYLNMQDPNNGDLRGLAHTWDDRQAMFNLQYEGIGLHAPELLKEAANAGPACDAVVLDAQTAAANQTAAAIVFNLLSAVADGLPIVAPFYSFSTVPPMVQAEGWKPGATIMTRYGDRVVLS